VQYVSFEMNGGKKIAIGIIGAGFLGFGIYAAIQRTRKDPPIIVKKKLRGNYNARTVPPFGIFITEAEKNNQALIDHEKVHWRQFRRRGLSGFYPSYLWQLKKYGYDGMPMEREARFNESEFCKDNYTHCVRTGLSRTVFNPDFRKD